MTIKRSSCEIGWAWQLYQVQVFFFLNHRYNIIKSFFSHLHVFEKFSLVFSKVLIQGVPELADQIETVYSLMVMKVKNV
jgi:hypothetical protein